MKRYDVAVGRWIGWIGIAACAVGCVATERPAADAGRPPSMDSALPAIEEALRGGPILRPAEVTAAPAAPDPPAAPEPPRPRSAALASGFHNPMPGGVMAGYQADTGLDIAGSPRPVYAIAAGTLDYSEPGHTLWTGPSDTANCVRFELDTPIPWRGRSITHVYYAHLSKLETLQREGEGPRRHIEAGEILGWSGIARHSPHLHIGLLLDRDVTQYWGTFLYADEIRKVLGGFKNGDKLPRDAPQ